MEMEFELESTENYELKASISHNVERQSNGLRCNIGTSI